MAAARAWANGDTVVSDDDAIADARRDGWPEEEIEALRIELGLISGTFKLWHQHARAFAALLAGRTQWRAGLALGEKGLTNRVFGLDYAGLKVALEALGLTLAPHEWGQLAVLEQAAAAAMNGEPGPQSGWRSQSVGE